MCSFVNLDRNLPLRKLYARVAPALAGLLLKALLCQHWHLNIECYSVIWISILCSWIVLPHQSWRGNSAQGETLRKVKSALGNGRSSFIWHFSTYSRSATSTKTKTSAFSFAPVSLSRNWNRLLGQCQAAKPIWTLCCGVLSDVSGFGQFPRSRNWSGHFTLLVYVTGHLPSKFYNPILMLRNSVVAYICPEGTTWDVWLVLPLHCPTFSA